MWTCFKKDIFDRKGNKQVTLVLTGMHTHTCTYAHKNTEVSPPVGDNTLAYIFWHFHMSPFKICQPLTTNNNKQQKQFIQYTDHHACCESGLCTGAWRGTRTAHYALTQAGDTHVEQWGTGTIPSRDSPPVPVSPSGHPSADISGTDQHCSHVWCSLLK